MDDAYPCKLHHENPHPQKHDLLVVDKDALDAARFYAATFPDSEVIAVHHAPGDYPSGREGDVLTVDFTVLGIPCMGINGGPAFRHSEAFSFQVATDTQEETDRYWNAIVGNGGEEAKRAFSAMMEMGKIDVEKIEAARRG